MATCLINIPHLFPLSSVFSFSSPCHFLLYRQCNPPWECDRSHSFLCCIAFARGHGETAENLCRYSRPFNRVCPQSNSLWKMTSRSAFRCEDRGPAVTHPSIDPAKRLGWSPGTGHLPHTEHCRLFSWDNLALFDPVKSYSVQLLSDLVKLKWVKNSQIFMSPYPTKHLLRLNWRIGRW